MVEKPRRPWHEPAVGRSRAGIAGAPASGAAARNARRRRGAAAATAAVRIRPRLCISSGKLLANAGALHDFPPAVRKTGKSARAGTAPPGRARRGASKAPETTAMSRNVPRSPSGVRAMSRSSGRMISSTPPTSPTFQSRLVLFGSLLWQPMQSAFITPGGGVPQRRTALESLETVDRRVGISPQVGEGRSARSRRGGRRPCASGTESRCRAGTAFPSCSARRSRWPDSMVNVAGSGIAPFLRRVVVA